ncbi:uncharacterized protein LOC131955455 [Physella acuta]|uniref:uncharacterized protein LOC131955455 n=1 Tax=Physella acuta TaxID=109671 RepID=UPI0027DABB14|nr:uncharacterized protein LOC131955455 [Physella acuta]
MFLSVLLSVALFSTFIAVTSQQLVIDVITNGTYRVRVNGVAWLTSGATFFNNDQKQFTNADNSLKLMSTTATSGYDRLGLWQNTNFIYQAGTLSVTASIKIYTVPDLPFIIFSQTYQNTATKTSAPDSKHVISGFPTFRTTSDADLGYVAYGGDMAGYSKLSVGRYNPLASITTGIEGGPLVLFDNSSNALVVSPMSQFMAASNQISLVRQELSYGIMGLVDSVPSNYSIDFIVYYSNQGINQAMKGWGELLKFWYNKNLEHRAYGITLNYMGYWTDNGAYYYYHTEEGKNYEKTMLDAVNYINAQKIPFKYTQYDSWWYAKGKTSGVLTWTPTPETIPDGFKYLSDQTKLPFTCHNRFWDSATPYARYNGGRYNFIPDHSSGLAVPDDDQFWLDLFNMTQQWGPFIMYEQDWLDKETDENKILQSDLFVGRRWLVGMGKGAEAYKTIGIQYCMSYSRHILQSLEIPTVTQARVSGDYQPGGRQWDIGISSMFADAVGVAPFKDTFWTTEVQAGSPYGVKTEKHTGLNSVISTLSTGPVGPGDGIGFINTTLLMRCCDSDGKILQPSVPATAIDDQMIKRAFLSYPGPVGEVYTTYSNISGLIFGIVLAAEMSNEYSLKPSNGWTFGQLPKSVVYSGTDSSKLPAMFSDNSPLELGPECSTTNFCLYYTSPILQLGVRTQVILLGEENKWVPLSPKRFYSIHQTHEDIIIVLNVNARESVTLRFMEELGPVLTVECDNSASDTPADLSFISIAERKCFLNSGDS